MKNIAIVGFGFCGKMAFYHLVKSAKNSAAGKIIIFDKAGENGLSAAFSSFSPNYILNVPAEKMSAFSEKPQDFCQFLEKKHPQIWQEIGAKGFAPRKIYGEYLRELTDEAFAEAAAKNIAVEFVEGEVLEVLEESQGEASVAKKSKISAHELSDEKFTIKTKLLQNEIVKSYQANEILLATSFSQSYLPFNFAAKNFIKKLWNKEALKFHQQNFSDEKICLIGSGLTAVDVIVGLKKKNFRGKIFVISRRGNFPQKHFAANPISQPFIVADDAKKGVLFLCLKIRKFLAENPKCDLRHAIDSMRPITKALWHNLDDKNKKSFLKLLPYWNIFRHRAPAFSIEIIEEMLATNQLEIKKCGVKNIVQKNTQFELERFEVESKNEKFTADYIVNCLGFEFNAQKYPVLQQMVAAGLLKRDLFLASSNNERIHLLGGLNISKDFECTSVPDLRANVEDVLKSVAFCV